MASQPALPNGERTLSGETLEKAKTPRKYLATEDLLRIRLSGVEDTYTCV